MKALIIILFLVLSTGVFSVVHADEKTDVLSKPENGYNSLIGIAFSSFSGTGASYGYRFIPEYMFKISGLYFENKDKEEDDGREYYISDVWWNCGAELQKNLFSNTNSGSIGIEGYGLIGGSYKFSEFEDPGNPEENDKSKTWVAGIALGARLIFFERVSINIDFGYQYSRDINGDERYTGIAGSAGAHFLF